MKFSNTDYALFFTLGGFAAFFLWALLWPHEAPASPALLIPVMGDAVQLHRS